MRRQKSWLDRLSAAARWRLGVKEGSEVTADYREIVGGSERCEEELVRDLGKPLDAVKPLTDQKAYRLWLAVFAALAACILTLGISPTVLGYFFWRAYFDRGHLGPVIALLGAAMALVWFRRREVKSARLSRAVPVLLAVLAAWTCGILLLDWFALRDPEGFAAAWGQVPSLLGPNRMVSLSAVMFGSALEYGAVLMALLGMFALVRARTTDRRWAAVYVLALATMVVSLEVLAPLWWMDDWVRSEYPAYLARCAAMFALGLIGTGVALC